MPVADGGETVWHSSGCRPIEPSARLFVIGDSHSLMVRPLLLQYAAERGRDVHAFFKSGCPFLPLQEPLARRPECAAYLRAATASLRRQLRPGDILVLPSLRMRRLADQAGGATAPAIPSMSDRDTALREGAAALAGLRATGAAIVFMAPPPVFHSPAFRCSDWFNHMNPICDGGLATASADLEAPRQAVLDAMRSFGKQDPAVTTWDPYPILCPGRVCRAMRAGRPLFFDGDHLSGFADALLYPSFAAHLDAVRLKKIPPSSRGQTSSSQTRQL